MGNHKVLREICHVLLKFSISSIKADSFLRLEELTKCLTFKITVLCLNICNEFVSGIFYLAFLFAANLQLQIHIKDNFFAP